MTNICNITRNFNGVEIKQRKGDGFLDATAMCKATGKLFKDYRRLQSTREFLVVLSDSEGIPVESAVGRNLPTEQNQGLIQIIQGGNPENQGSWVHPKVSINLAQWCSPKFAVMVTDWIFELLTTGRVELQASQPTEFPKNLSYFGELSQATLAKCAPNLGVVYAIELDNGYIKIGQTKNPGHRITNLARSYRPFIKVKRVAVTKDCTNYIPLERQIHKKFAENWFANEYFLVPMLEVVAAMAEMKLRNSGSLQSDLPVHLIWESIKSLIECYNQYIQSDYYTFSLLQKIKEQLLQLESYYLNDGKVNIMRLLLIEDDTLLGNGIQTGLMQTNYAVDWITDGEAGEHALKVEKYDALILDLNLPKKDGLKILKDLRARGDTLPVLILTARDTINDKVIGLDSGADDYLVKPFDLDELSARLRALLRRHSGRATPYIEYDNLRLEPATHILTQNGQTVMLSQREFAILQTLLENLGQILSRSRLEESLYGWDDMIESNAVEVHIHHLRKKLGKKLIHTVRGIGYMVPKKL